MVHGYHVVFGTYGFWLPNDPRGSWFDFVWSWELFRFGGRATKTETRESAAHAEHDIRKRLETKKCLKYPSVMLSGVQARAVGHGFAIATEKADHPVFACSILPEHVHLVFGRCRCGIERIVSRFKQRATLQLIEEGIHPLAGFDGPPRMWGVSCWKVFLNDENALRRAVRYVEENPIKEGKRPQKWSFVRPLD